ncbi:MAG: bL35 family ribosomal protein [Kiritimatiellia bacterium]
MRPGRSQRPEAKALARPRPLSRQVFAGKGGGTLPTFRPFRPSFSRKNRWTCPQSDALRVPLRISRPGCSPGGTTRRGPPRGDGFMAKSGKTRKAVAKRFKVTANGKLKFRSPGKRHLASSKSRKAQTRPGLRQGVATRRS